MVLEAVWLKNGKEVYKVSPVMNLLCEDNMENLSEIEVSDGGQWYSTEDIGKEVDNFLIRIKS